MNKVRNIFYYLKNLTFICFLYSSILLYPNLIKGVSGKVCLIILVIYSLFTFFMIFVKNENEEKSIFNNIVICLLHFYFSFVAYKYCNSIGFEIVDKNFFSLNYFIASLAMVILIFNKFTLWLNK